MYMFHSVSVILQVLNSLLQMWTLQSETVNAVFCLSFLYTTLSCVVCSLCQLAFVFFCFFLFDLFCCFTVPRAKFVEFND